MEKRNLYFVIAAVLVLGLILSFSGLTGKSIKNPNTATGECLDSDNADNPDIPGTVSFSNIKTVYKDECFSESGRGPKKYVRERFCLDRMDTQIYLCYNGCSENAEGEGYCNEGGFNPIRKE